MRQTRIALRPVVVPLFLPASHTSWQLKVKNIGSGSGFNIKIRPVVIEAGFEFGYQFGQVKFLCPQDEEEVSITQTIGDEPHQSEMTKYSFFPRYATAEHRLVILFEDVEGSAYRLPVNIKPAPRPAFQEGEVILSAIEGVPHLKRCLLKRCLDGFTCQKVARELQRQGYVLDDTLAALNLLLQRQLIAADHMNFSKVEPDDSVHITASGFIHVRILSARIEYIYGVLPVTPILDREVASKLAEFVRDEKLRGDLGSFQKVRALEIFHGYLARQRRINATPFSPANETGAAYVLNHIAEAIQYFKNVTAAASFAGDELDFP